MNIPSFNDFKINTVSEEMTAGDKLEKRKTLDDKLADLKKQYQEALDANDNKKADVLKVKIDMAKCDIDKFDLQVKLERISK